MKKLQNFRTRTSIHAAAGMLAMLFVTAAAPSASAQAPDAADRCTPDVMRLCSEFVPDADRIVACLKSKRRQLSPSCSSALTPASAKASSSKAAKSSSAKAAKSSSSKSTKKRKTKGHSS